MSGSDGQVVGCVRRGDVEAFGVLVRRHVRNAYGVALAYTGEHDEAEDVCQDAFIVALRRIGDCRDPERFGKWLLAIVRNRAFDLRRRAARHPMAPLRDTLPAGERVDPSREAERAELSADLDAAMASLSATQRAVVRLYDIDGLSHREVAKRLSLTEGSARVILCHARRTLRGRLAPAHGGSA